jgi:hypothetical protein
MGRATLLAAPAIFALALAAAIGAPGSSAQNSSAAGAQSAAQPKTQAAAPSGAPAAAESHSQHSVTLNFQYDFAQTPACSKKIAKSCVQQFVVYDISAGDKHRIKLFTIPLPERTATPLQTVTATSPRLDWESGKHLLAVVAAYPDGRESPDRACTTWITIP